jgi:tripartite-type tricarboxylate transporter receptor subunit TctC
MREPKIVQRLSESGYEPQTSSPEEFAAYMKNEIEKWRKVIRESNVSLD